jgi:hypothetical protein
MKSERVHLNGFDWVRAVMSVFIVTWHVRTFGLPQLYTGKLDGYAVNLGDVLNFGVVMLAVPVFITVSCYLLVRFPVDWPRLRTRLWRLLLLVVFWTVMLSLWKGGFDQLRHMLPHSPLEAVIKILSANGEYYYFFLSLIFCLLITFGFMRLSTRWNVIALAASVATVFLLPLFAIQFRLPLLVTYWSPLNFLPYPFLAIVIFRSQAQTLATARNLTFAVLACVGLAVLFGWYEWTHYVNPIFAASDELAFPLYMRNSLVFGAAAVVLTALWPWKTASAFIRFMSTHSLALFVLHGFFRPIVLQNLPFAFLPGDVLPRLAQTVVVILLSYAVSLAAPLFLKEELIR